MMLILGGGVTLGGLASRFRTTIGLEEHGKAEQPVVFHKELFAQASSIDSVVMLAHQLPKSDAEHCAALAQAMLNKRIQVTVEDGDQKTAQEQVLPTRVWEGLFKRWMQVAPQAAWAFVGKHHGHELPLRTAALRQWALLDPMAAAKAAGSAISEEEKFTIAKACIEANPAVGLHLLVEWGVDFGDSNEESYSEDEPDSLGEIISALLEKYAEKSPRAALEFCQLHEPKLVRDVCAGWMRQDSGRCLAWIQEQPQKEQKEILHTLTYEADVKAETVRRLAVLCEPSERRKTIGGGINLLAQRDASAAQDLIDELLSNPTDRLILRDDIANEMANADPRKAMDFVMISLREPMPIYSEPWLMKILQTSPGYDFDRGPNFGNSDEIFSNYLALGQEAGITREDVLQRLHEIHPQYRTWIFESNLEELRGILGSPSQWMPTLIERLPKEQILNLVDFLDYSTSEQLIKEMDSSPQGAFRDALAQRSFEMMLEEEVPVATVLEKAQEWGGDFDWSKIYESWAEQSPEEAVNHLMQRTNATAGEWDTVIRKAYMGNAEVLENAVENMPQGALRDASVSALSYSALWEKHDIVTSLYWATDIKNRANRYASMKELWRVWQEDEGLSADVQVTEGVRQNINNSTLDAQEKALWLSRLESEVLK
jgi:hypothetical protein